MGTPRIDRYDRNLIINGNMDFWQRVVGTVTNVSSASVVSGYAADRFKYATLGGAGSTKAFSIQRAADVPTLAQSGFTSTYSSLFSVASGNSAYTATDAIVPWMYTVEGMDYAQIHSQTVTLSFWFKCSSGGVVLPVSLRNATSDRSYVTTFTTGATNVWTPIALTIPLDNMGTWAFDSGAGLVISIAPTAGSNFFTNNINVWQSGNYLTAPNVAYPAYITGFTARLAQVQLIQGTFASPPFFKRSGANVAQELAFCQRYYEKSYDVEVIPGSINGNGAFNFDYPITTVKVGFTAKYTACKRTSPTVSVYSPNTGAVNRIYVSNGTDQTAFIQSGGQGSIEIAQASGANLQWQSCQWTADADY